jgi:hypothetical protein
LHYAFGINFEGTASLDPTEAGGRILTLSGSGEPPESTDQWQISMRAPQADTDRPAEPATLTIVAPLGDRIDAVLGDEAVAAVTNGAGSAESDAVDLHFTVAGGTGGFSDASGSIRLHGTLLPQGFLLTADLNMEVGAQAYRPPDARPISPAEDAAGGSHVGPQTLSQKQAEREAEAELTRRARQRPG